MQTPRSWPPSSPGRRAAPLRVDSGSHALACAAYMLCRNGFDYEMSLNLFLNIKSAARKLLWSRSECGLRLPAGPTALWEVLQPKAALGRSSSPPCAKGSPQAPALVPALQWGMGSRMDLPGQQPLGPACGHGKRLVSVLTPRFARNM